MSADTATAKPPSYSDLFAAQMRAVELEAALRKVRKLAIPAGAAFVRGNPDGADRCREVLDIIDAALKPST